MTESNLHRFVVSIDLGKCLQSREELGRKERIAAKRLHFEERSDAAKQAIQKLGIVVLGQAWINQTILIELADEQLDANILEELQSIPNVVDVSGTRLIEKDS